jgi:hypothetical protein
LVDVADHYEWPRKCRFMIAYGELAAQHMYMDLCSIGSVITHNIQKAYVNLDLMALNTEDGKENLMPCIKYK